MDCYIIRVYRHLRSDGDQADEIAGLVEHVGEQEKSRPFTSYHGLVEEIRTSLAGTADNRRPAGNATGSNLRLVKKTSNP